MKDLLRSPVIAALLFLAGVGILATRSSDATVYKWSQTAATNANSDATINWAEGMAPSAVNDSARAMMAALAKYRDDVAGALATTGTSTAYVLTSNQGFSSLSAMNNQKVCFTPNVTSGGAATINVDSLGVKPLRAAPSDDLNNGALVTGTPYCAVYNNANGEWIVTYVNANTTIPLGAMIDYPTGASPSSNFALPAGQAISRTTYATLFGLISTTYGTGDGSTTFNIPDLRGRVIASLDNLNGSAANRITSGGSGITGTSLGASGGAETITLAQSAIPNVTLTLTGSGTVTPTAGGGSGASAVAGNPTGTNVTTGGGIVVYQTANFSSMDTKTVNITGTTSSINGGVGQTSVNKVQPTIILGKIMRIL